jgi:AraC family transcriptional regulator of adaptative response / DNA-3-methyladenine glycosylase II
MFDLDADLPAINAHLSADPSLAPSVAARPWVRVAGGWDPFEIAIRTVVGQQVSVARARQLNGVLAERCASGRRPKRSSAQAEVARAGLRFPFPTPREVLAADLSALGMPGARVQTLRAVATAAIEQPDLFARGATLDDTIARLRRVKGIGEWTAHYIAMRACREPDAFPASDVGLLRGAADAAGVRPSAAALLARAEAWRPWRAYAAHHLWAMDSTARDGVPRIAVDATLQS